MERIKRRLDRFVPMIGPARAVVPFGLPPASDVEGQLRAEGLECLLAAHGVALLDPAAMRGGALPGSVAVWLGGGAPEELDALRRQGSPGRVLLWPRAEQVVDARVLLAGWSGPPPILCSPDEDAGGAAGGGSGQGRTHVLPDPAHALWGLLDHHPHGKGLLELPDDGWDGLLPAARLAMLRRCARKGPGPPFAGLGPRLRRVARRRVLEAARRAVTAHAAVSGTSVGGSVLAALLGRVFRPAPAAGPDGAARIAAYWARWRAVADAG